MDDLTLEIESILTEKLNLTNIYDIVEFTDNLQVPKLKFNLVQFIKIHILQLDLKQFSKSILKTLTSTPTGHIKDEHGRLYDLIESELILFQALTFLDQSENWNFSKVSKKRQYFALYVQDYNIPEDKMAILKQKLDSSSMHR